MPLIDRIYADMIASQKAGDSDKLTALRYLRSALLSRAKDLHQETLTDEEAEAVIAKEVKKHRDSIVAYQAGNRADLVAKEQQELDWIAGYLPPTMSDDELRQLIAQTLAAAGLTAPYDFGKTMGLVMKAVGSRADGNKVRALIQELTKA